MALVRWISKTKFYKSCLMLIAIVFLPFLLAAQQYQKGELIYSDSLSDSSSVSGWIMEGPGSVGFKDGWMHMQSPKQKGHHVFWCPVDFPEDFIAEWEVKNLDTTAGLCIVFFAAKGLYGEDIFSNTLPRRNGVFKQYTNGAINNYHISYYANSKNQPGRSFANLRKNKGFKRVQKGQPGIPANSVSVHKIQLVKKQGRIIMYIDERRIIDWQDDGKSFGPVLQAGKIGFRQMKWTSFAYRNFRVWSVMQARHQQ